MDDVGSLRANLEELRRRVDALTDFAVPLAEHLTEISDELDMALFDSNNPHKDAAMGKTHETLQAANVVLAGLDPIHEAINAVISKL